MNLPSLKIELERLHRDSFAWAVCCIGSREEAEDLLQTVYLKILQGRARYAGRSSVKTWLFAVIRNTSASRRRWRAARELKAAAIGLLRGGRDEPAPPALLADRELNETVALALAKLPGRQRQVVRLTFYDGLSLSEAAAVMGVSLGSARTHFHRGKQSLRERLSPEGAANESSIRRRGDRSPARPEPGRQPLASVLV